MSIIKDIVDSDGCSLPWLHVEISLQENKIWPCCKYKETAARVTDNFIDSWNNKKFTDLRSDILTNRTHVNCKACDVDKHSFSYKKFKNDQYKSLLYYSSDPVPLPRAFNFTLKNTCNLSCRMCSPSNSSKFLQLTRQNSFIKNLYNYKNIDNKFDIEKLAGSFSNAHYLVITGGEPLIDEDCIKLIELVQSESRVLKHISFSTNLTMYNDKLISVLEKSNANITFNVSIDGPVQIHEYIRIGCDFGQIRNNLKTLSKIQKFKFRINSTISALNVGYLLELLEECELLEQETQTKFMGLMTSPVLQPQLHVGSLPKEIKDQYMSKLNLYQPSNRITNDMDLLNTGKSLLLEDTGQQELLSKFLNEFDLIAKTNRYDIYPEFQNIL